MDTSSVGAFLRSTKLALLHSQTTSPVDRESHHVVLGNEAADCDSIISAIVTAFWMALGAEKENQRGRAPLIFPVINCNREDLPLRTEATYLLSCNQIPLDSLICKDEVDLRALHKAGKLKLTLVDHNVLAEGDSVLGGSVVRVIDHHKRDRPFDPRDIIEPVGSCSTLVAELTLGLLDNDPVVVNLLYATILLDTVNLSPTAKKATPKDFKAISDLEDILVTKAGSDRPSRDEVYGGISAARADISSLSPAQLLRKDCKVLRTPELSIAVPAVPLLAQKFLELDGAAEALQTALRLNEAAVLVVMGWEVGSSSSSGPTDMQRDLLIYSDSAEKTKGVVAVFESCEALGLQLVLQSPPDSSPVSFVLFHQGNVALSRKFILPFLASHFEPKTQTPGDVADALAGVEILLPAGEASPPKPNTSTSCLVIPAVSLGGVNTLAIGDPISHGGSNQSSAYNSCPYTPQNSCAEPAEGDLYGPGDNYFLPSFNSREMIEKIKMKRGKLRDYDPKGESDQLSVGGATSYPFTPKNSYVDSSFDSYFSAEVAARQSHGGGAGVLNAIDSEVLLRKLLEKRRTTAETSSYSNVGSSNASSKSQSLTKLNILDVGGTTTNEAVASGGDFVSIVNFPPSPKSSSETLPFEQQHDPTN